MILDSRYPLLAQNDDGSVVSMLHSVVFCIEVKTNIRTSDIDRICDNSKTIIALANGVFRTQRAFGDIACKTFAYRSADTSQTDLYLLRVPNADRSGTRENGVLVHLEPSFADGGDVKEWVPFVISTRRYPTSITPWYRTPTTASMRGISRWGISGPTLWSTWHGQRSDCRGLPLASLRQAAANNQ